MKAMHRYMERLAREWWVWNPDEAVLNDEDGMVEHLVHETAHALSMGVTPAPGMEMKAGDAIGRLTPEAACAEEALVLAAEEVTLRGLGIYAYGYADGGLAADVQGVDSAIFEEAWGSDRARLLGLKVLRYLGRRSGCYRSGRKDMPHGTA